MSFKTKGDGGRELRLSFIRGSREVQLGKNAGRLKPFIECHILTGTAKENLTLLGQGVSTPSFTEENPITPEEGRQIALLRAVEAAMEGKTISRAERGALLKTYYTRPYRGRMGQGRMELRNWKAVSAANRRRKKQQPLPVQVPAGLTLPPEGWQGKEAQG